MWRELAIFNLSDRVFDQLAEFLPLLLRDRSVQVLNFHQTLADEDDFGYLSNAGHPGIADQLRV